MTHRTPRRLLAGLGVALAAATVAVPGTPASAAAIDTLAIHASPALKMAPGTYGSGALHAESDSLQLLAEQITFDISGIAGFASFDPDTYDTSSYSCRTAGTVVTCTTDVPSEGEEGQWINLVDFQVGIAQNAAPGTTGTIKINVAAGDRSADAITTVTVTEPVDLATVELAEQTAALGSTVTVPAVVKNVGATAVSDFYLTWQTESGLDETTRYSNCRYLDEPNDWDPSIDVVAHCRFDGTIAPGQTLRLPESFGFTVAKDLWAPSRLSTYLSWWPAGDYEDINSGSGDEPWQQGTGPALELRSVPDAAAARAPQQDQESWDNGTELRVEVTGDQKADVTAIGETVTADKGATVTATAGFTNLGPARLNGVIGGWMPSAIVTIPEGTTAVGASERCRPIFSGDKRENWETGELGEAGGKSYICGTNRVLLPGATVEFPFGLRVDGDFASSTGAVTLRLFNVQSEGEGKDLNADDNVAQLVVKSNGSGELVSGGGGGEGGGGGGGTLPVTGLQTGLIGAAGAALLALGVGAFLVARRRRTSFVA